MCPLAHLFYLFFITLPSDNFLFACNTIQQVHLESHHFIYTENKVNVLSNARSHLGWNISRKQGSSQSGNLLLAWYLNSIEQTLLSSLESSENLDLLTPHLLKDESD